MVDISKGDEMGLHTLLECTAEGSFQGMMAALGATDSTNGHSLTYPEELASFVGTFQQENGVHCQL